MTNTRKGFCLRRLGFFGPRMPPATVTLGPLDSCHLGPGEARAIENRGNAVATMLVVLSKTGA